MLTFRNVQMFYSHIQTITNRSYNAQNMYMYVWYTLNNFNDDILLGKLISIKLTNDIMVVSAMDMRIWWKTVTLSLSLYLSLSVFIWYACCFCWQKIALCGFCTWHLKNHRKYLAVIFIWRNSNSISGTFIRTKRNEFINAIPWCGVVWCRMAVVYCWSKIHLDGFYK